MSQVSGSLTLELDLDRLAEQVAVRVVALLVDEQRQRGSAEYHRATDPDPGRAWSGTRFGGVEQETGAVIPEEPA